MRWLATVALLCSTLAAAVEYPPVVAGRTLSFPADGGAHPEFRTEWWYVTGWLDDASGRERGFQLTFFRVRSGVGEGVPGRFSPAQLILAHAAVADPNNGKLLKLERSARVGGRVAGAATAATDVWLGNWRLREEGDGYVAEVDGETFGYRLRLRPDGPPMLNGEAGFSRKGPQPTHASYYYSRPQLEVEGELRLCGETLEVSGRAWLDQEWSSELMPEGAVGWDWIGLNLDDGGALMAFRMRDAAGKTLWSGATRRQPNGEHDALEQGHIRFLPLREWTSPRTGARYPVAWRIEAGDLSFDLEPLMDDQELDSSRSTGAVYWEGAVRAMDGKRQLGRGYLEMTGYSERLRM